MKEYIKNSKMEASIKLITSLMNENNGYITSKQITDLGIHRMYLNIMVKNNFITRVRSGVYMKTDIIEDPYYTFMLKYPDFVFSGFTALYFHDLTETFPYKFSVTVHKDYHSVEVEKKHKVSRVDKNILNLGITKVKTNFGNIVNAYDKERCICDIIKYKNKLDFEQVKKSVRFYVKDKNTNGRNLDIYAKKMGIYNDVMEFVGMYYE